MMDIAEERLKLMADFAKKACRAAELKTKIEWTTDRHEALKARTCDHFPSGPAAGPTLSKTMILLPARGFESSPDASGVGGIFRGLAPDSGNFRNLS